MHSVDETENLFISPLFDENNIGAVTMEGEDLKCTLDRDVSCCKNASVNSSKGCDVDVQNSVSFDFDSSLDTAMVDVVIDRVRSVTFRAPVIIEGLEVNSFVDTGAEVTVMSDFLFYRIPEQKRPVLRKAKRSLVVAEAGKKMLSLGVADVEIVIGPAVFIWSIYVAPIGDELLLGCDIIDHHDITINTRRGLEIQGQWIDCDVQRRSDKVATVLLKENTMIPPNSEVILQGFSLNSEVLDTRYGSIEPVVEDEIIF